MNLKTRIKEDLKTSMKNGESSRKDLLRVALSTISYEEGKKKDKELDDADIEKLMRGMIKNMQEIIDKGSTIKNIADTQLTAVMEAKAEIIILTEYLPKLMSEEDIKETVSNIIKEGSYDSMSKIGMVMRDFNIKHKGKADNNIVKKVATEILS